MSTATVEGLVLRRWDSGENDRRIALLTRERGKVYAVARGARKAASKLAGVTEPLMLSKFQLAYGRRNVYVTQAQSLGAYLRLRSDYQRLLAGLAWAEALDAVLPTGEPQPEAFALCLAGLAGIEAAKEPLGALAWVDLKLMELAGFAPQFSVSVVSGKALRGEKVWLSPQAGGALAPGEEKGFRDCVRVSREVAVTLCKLQGLQEPPSYVKKAREVVQALAPFWVEVAGRDMPTRRRLLEAASA